MYRGSTRRHARKRIDERLQRFHRLKVARRVYEHFPVVEPWHVVDFQRGAGDGVRLSVEVEHYKLAERFHGAECTPSIASWLKTKGLTADGGYEYFVKQYQAIAHAKGRDVAGWEEIWHHFGTELDKSTIIHQWLGGSTAMPNLTAHGAFDTQSFTEPRLLLCRHRLATFYSNTRTCREQVTVGCGPRMGFGTWTD